MKRSKEAKSKRKNKWGDDLVYEDWDYGVIEEMHLVPDPRAYQGLKPDQYQLVQAVKNRSVNKVRTFLDRGLDPTFTILPKRETVLHVALSQYLLDSKAAEKIVRLLLFFGCDPNAVDNEEDTPLLLTCRQIGKNFNCIEMLLQSGAEVNKISPYSRETPLVAYCSSSEPKLKIVKLFVNHGADTSIVNHHQQNVLHLLCSVRECKITVFEERNRIIRFLLEQGVPCHQVDTHGKTPLNYEIFRLLCFFNASDVPIRHLGYRVIRNAIKALINLVAGGALSNFEAHKEELKALLKVMLEFKRYKKILCNFFLSIRKVIPLSEFQVMVDWTRESSDFSLIEYFRGKTLVTVCTAAIAKNINMKANKEECENIDDDDDDYDDDFLSDEDDKFNDNNTAAAAASSSSSSSTVGAAANSSSDDRNFVEASTDILDNMADGSAILVADFFGNYLRSSTNPDNPSLLQVECDIRWTSPPALLILSKVVVRSCLAGRVAYLACFLDILPEKHRNYIKSI